MATRVPQKPANGQNGIRGDGGSDIPGNGWSLFGTEFTYWVVIVSLILIILLVLIPFVLHLTVKLDRQIKHNEAILQRLDEKEKKNAKARIDPKPDDADGL